MGRKQQQKLKKSVSVPLDSIAGRSGADTIRLWESYREQAYLWRALALLQMPATAISIAAALIMYFFSDTIIEVPDLPQPGFYSVKKLPDSQFINSATEVVNAISTYQPYTAENQFLTARKVLWEPALTFFDETMLKTELRAILDTGRTQMFFVNDKLVQVERYPDRDYVVVRIPGTLRKMIGNKPLPPEQMAYFVKMTTIPRNVHNQYGIVIVDIRLKKVELKELASQDRRAAAKIRKKQQRENR